MSIEDEVLRSATITWPVFVIGSHEFSVVIKDSTGHEARTGFANPATGGNDTEIAAALADIRSGVGFHLSVCNGAVTALQAHAAEVGAWLIDTKPEEGETI